MNETVQKKLNILADAAKFDVSCASSGNNRSNSRNKVLDMIRQEKEKFHRNN